MALAAWDAYAERLPAVSDGRDVALVAVFVFPATFLVAWLLLPLAGERRLLGAALRDRSARGVLRPCRGGRVLQRREARRLLPLRVLVRPDARGARAGSSSSPWSSRGSTWCPSTAARRKSWSRSSPASSSESPWRSPCPAKTAPPASARRHHLLRALPRGRGAVRAARSRDLARHGGRAVGDPPADLRARPERAAGAARDLPRLPRPERRPALALASCGGARHAPRPP